jgi:hypothetical protein
MLGKASVNTQNKQRIRQLFIEVANKAREAINRGATHKPQPGIVTNSLLIRNGLIFESDVADLFFKNVDEAAELAKENPAWSKSSIDRIFSEGLAALSNGVEIADATNGLKLKLDKKPEKFALRLGVFGLDQKCQATNFGKIRLRPDSITPTYDSGPFLKAGMPITYHSAELDVDAIDIESAKLRGSILLDKHLAILNILCADGNPTLTYLSQNYSGPYAFGIHQEKVGDIWTEGISSSRTRLPVMPTEWKKILESVHFKKFNDLLNTESSLAEHLSSALELAGSTFQEQSPQNTFLLLTIALESALMGGKREGEITHQFAVRAALLSIGAAEQKVALHQRIKRLYGLRSAIVHSGSKDITDKDLIEMRNTCLGCLVTLCTSNQFASMNTFEQLNDWFLKQMLSGSEIRDSVVNRTGVAHT